METSFLSVCFFLAVLLYSQQYWPNRVKWIEIRPFNLAWQLCTCCIESGLLCVERGRRKENQYILALRWNRLDWAELVKGVEKCCICILKAFDLYLFPTYYLDFFTSFFVPPMLTRRLGVWSVHWVDTLPYISMVAVLPGLPINRQIGDFGKALST